MIIALYVLGQHTGIVARDGADLVGYDLVRRAAPAPYLSAVRGTVDGMRHRFGSDRYDLALEYLGTPEPGHGMQYREQHKALLLGALLHRRPLIGGRRGYGSWLLDAYPPELVGERERRGAGRARVLRAAWDLAGGVMPDGPPTAAAELAALRSHLVEVEHSPIQPWGNPLLTAQVKAKCAVCVAQGQSWGHMNTYLREGEGPEAWLDGLADTHVRQHLEGSGRAGSTLLPGGGR